MIWKRPLRVSSKRIRLLAGIGAVLLSLLLGAVPATAFVTQTVVDVVSDFSSGTFDRTGLVNIPAENVSGVQLMPIGLSGEWVQDSRSLPVALQELAAVSYGNYIYVLGGRLANGQATNRVFYLKANADGSIASISESANRLPVALAGASAFVHETDGVVSIYVIGGAPIGLYSDWVPSKKTYRAEIDPTTGAPGSWDELLTQLPYGLYYAAVAVRGRDVYLAGGIQREDDLPFLPLMTTVGVMHSRLDTYGDLGEWELDTVPSLEQQFDQGVAAAQAIVYEGDTGDTIYVIGGRANATSQGGSFAAYIKVAYADIDDDGNLSAWAESAGNLPVPLHGHGAVLVGGEEILLSGGRTDPNDPNADLQNTVKAALIDPTNASFRLYDWCGGIPGCKIGAWQTGALLPQTRAYHGMVAVGDWVYVLGGSDASNQATTTIYRGRVSGVAAVYAPDGTYESAPLSVSGGDVVRLQWDAVVPAGNSMLVEYSWKPMSGAWSQWQSAGYSVDGNNVFTMSPWLDNVDQIRYRLTLASVSPYNTSPRLERLAVVYDAPPPDISVTLRANKTAVRPGDYIVYTIDYRNSGGVAAENVTITNFLPQQVRCLSTDWTALGNNTFSYSLGRVAAGAVGSAKLTAQVGQIPEGVNSLIDRVEAAFPAMTDLDGNLVADPLLQNNVAQLEVGAYALAILGTPSAEPAPGANVSPGQEIEYRLSYKVSGTSNATGVVISASVDPSKLTGVQPLDGGVLEGNTARWYLQGSLPPGYAGTLRFRARIVRPLANGTGVSVGFTASADQLPAETIATIAHNVISSPQLWLSVEPSTAAPGIVRPGEAVTYTITCRNDGGMNASGAAVSADLGQGLALLFTEPQAQVNGQTVGWQIGNLAVDLPVTLKIVAQVADNVVHGQSVSLSATLSGTGVPDAEAAATLMVSVPPSISLAKAVQAAGASVRPGEWLTYTLSAMNTGGEATGPVTLTDWVPLYTHGANGEAPGTMLRWQMPELVGGQMSVLSYQVLVDDPLAEAVQYIEGFSANARASDLTAYSSAVRTPVHHWPNLWAQLSDGATTVLPGQALTYSLTYGNRGSTTDGVSIVVSLGPYLLWQGGEGWEALPDGRYRYTVGTLAVGASGTASFTAKVAESTPIDPALGLRAEGSITGAERDGDDYDNACSDVDILAGPDLAVVGISASPTAPSRGQSLALSVEVANLGGEPLSAYAMVAGLAEVAVEVYVKPSVSAPPAGPQDHLGGYCLDASCAQTRAQFRQMVSAGDLGPGRTLTLVFPVFSRLDSAGVFDIYAQVDTGGDATWGGFREGNEENNLGSLRRFFVADTSLGPGYYLPLVAKASSQ
ncbi:MAG: hypothetical protein ACUVWR_04760 [Anaerolineae bacterium]